MERRVVITGCSAITPIGCSKADILKKLECGISGVGRIRDDELLVEQLNTSVFGTVDEDLAYDFPRKFRKTMGPVSFAACRVVDDVIQQSGLDSSFLSSGRTGVAFGSSHGSTAVLKKVYQACFNAQSTDMFSLSAADYLKSMVHTTAVNITRMFGITGRVISSPSACTTSSQSIGFGYEMIKFGVQDAMICGGSEEYDTTTVAVFDNLLACSTHYNDTPHKTPRPFDAERDGLVVGEGAGAVMLEDFESARKRGAIILGEVIGFATNNNGGNLIMPDLAGVTQVLKMGLENAQIPAEQIDFISAHATATRIGDVIEARAINNVYGNKPWVSGLKSYMGHTIAACGVIETILTLYMMEKGFIVPTLNLDQVDDRCAMIHHTPRLMETEIQCAAVQNFAFGGINTSLILKKFPRNGA
ncbi:3-oxoacyl-ACP synthase [Desulfobacter hydrogenophilus]|uniref:3-oxoacyl-ACP synthase n=1 Tax=Desulfobacter hydrogenophilus TaxID=2291 RepID=A0A328F6Q5_9BACT|nr:beta-ketoacyl synthase N-terminal-like domain-containing protein [Desulfobacter hydrogenophilus]NDY74529.1 3-oxoacyl-ACP synthase [Desulfobacter hydrogenophilus]QBH13355.1 3-oxoacyl-ACP synthase [Desulfobacter hydrogenophilus]RAL99905.1 3-oxoacyl-ACP synthase [Desulfobacter hydrogenophilus]